MATKPDPTNAGKPAPDSSTQPPKGVAPTSDTPDSARNNGTINPRPS